MTLKHQKKENINSSSNEKTDNNSHPCGCHDGNNHHTCGNDIHKCCESMESCSDAEPTPNKDTTQLSFNSPLEKIEELTLTLQRLQADFENFKKRGEREQREFGKFANAKLIEKFLPILDTLDSAIKNAQSQKENPQYIKGLELLSSQILNILKSEGLETIDCIGKSFDPHLHDVLMKEGSQEKDGKILEEFQKGYILNGKILRHSKVKISGS